MADARAAILFVEPLPDGPSLRAVLERDGHHIESAPDVERAVVLLKGRAFEGVLMGGIGVDRTLDALARLRRAAGSETPILVVTAAADVAARALARGAAGMLVPPVDAAEARTVIGNARAQRRLDRDRLALLEDARATRKFYEDVLRGLGEGILVIDREGKIRYRNPEAARIMGEDDDEVDGDKPSSAKVRLQQKALAPLIQILVETLTDGEGKVRTLVVQEEDQKLFLDATTSVLRDGDGRTTSAVAIVRDRSAEKLLEEQVVHTERLATLGSLLAAIAHDIANPLNVITGAAEIGFEAAKEAEEAGKRSAEPDASSALARVAADVREVLEQVREAGIRCHTICANLLQYSRRVPAHVREEDLNELVNRTLAFIGKYLGTDRVEVTLKLDPTLPKVRVDASQVQQALTNLIDNAVHAMLEGKADTRRIKLGEPPRPRPRLTIETKAEDGRAAIRIADQGPGISRGRLEHIWRPFYTTKARGTGLGLYITRKVVEHQGGTIMVESEVGKGTTFTIRIPI